MIKALILDLDGVICDTAHFHFVAWQALASKWGLILTPEDHEKLKGVSRIDSLNYLLNKAQITCSAEEKELLMAEKNAHYLTWVQDMSSKDLFPGVRQFLETAKKKNYKMALGSASRNARLILDKLEITALFDAIVDANLVINGKPHPETFLKAASLLGYKAHECAVFEDAASGITAANAAGMWSVGVGDEKNLSHAKQVVPSLGLFNFNQAFQQTPL